MGASRASCAHLPGLCSAWEPSQAHGHPTPSLYSKGKKEEIQRTRRGQRPEGPTPTPLQATLSRLLGKGGAGGGNQDPEAPPPESGIIQRLLIFGSTPAAAFHVPRSPGQGRVLPPQYLLIPKIRTPCSCGSFGMRTLISDTVLRTKWTWSYLV